jgi:tripartite-type tricarboxylate transporter receptor subunit TctC
LIVIKRRTLLRGALAAPAVLTLQGLAGKAGAQTFPSRPIRVIWPGAPGGGPYATLRLIALKAEEKGATILIEGRVGANGVVAAAAVKNADPDGYTIVLGHNATHAANVTLIKHLPYDPVTDFEPITLLFELHQVLLVPSSLGVKSVQELRDLARSKPGGLSYASTGVGAAAHMMGAMLAKAFGTTMTHVPYANSSAAHPDLLKGRVDLMFNTLPLFEGEIERGTIRALAVASRGRLSHAPDLPTLAESGYPDIEIESWFGLFAPARTDPARLETLNALFRPAAESIAERVAKQGFIIRTSTRVELADLVKREIARLGAMIREIGIQPI